ncbi:MAG: RMD1 family protein [Leptolyngbya sp. DLM2.Bin15]|nr:MAG: RMD1 family protein [Leptolyngbya sp. DLM2.Bin15]
MEKLLFSDNDLVSVRALFVGESLDLKLLEKTDPLAIDPLVVSAGDHGCAVLFRYGAAVLFGLDPLEQVTFLQQLDTLVVKPLPDPATEDVNLRLDTTGVGRVENDVIWLSGFSVEQLQLVADVLAKSVVLEHYEAGTAKIFDQIEPFANSLQLTAKNASMGKELLRQIGRTLSIQNRIVGRVEIIDKPELLWDAPELERIYLRLEDEYEIRERNHALERKLDLISRTAETALELLQYNTSHRVEWYIVILIVVEILLSLYELFGPPAAL